MGRCVLFLPPELCGQTRKELQRSHKTVQAQDIGWLIGGTDGQGDLTPEAL